MLSSGAESGSPMAYQWFRNGAALPGATGRAHVLTNVQPADAGVYHVTAANGIGLVSSDAVLTVVPAGIPPILAGPVINPANRNEYYLLDQSTWVEAEARARALGGHLATLRDAGEQEWLFTNFGMFGGEERNLWIGLHDADPLNNATNSAERQAEFVWASGEPVSYSKWANGLPNNSLEMGEYYAHMLAPGDPTTAGEWIDTSDANFNQKPIHGVAEVVRRRIAGLSQNGSGQFELQISGSPGDACRILASTNLVHWEVIGTVTNLNGTMQFQDTEPIDFSQRFYRLLPP